MDQQAVGIKNKTMTAPTPQNTPSNPAPINSQFHPNISAITEEMETITTHGAAHDNAFNKLPSVVQRRINGLKFLQSKHTDLEGKFQEEVLALEKKYLELYRPYYEKRSQVINGKYEPTEEEVAIGAKVDEESDNEEDEEIKEADEEEENTGDITGIPEFWLTTLKTHPQIGESITEKDDEVLKNLVDIRMKYLEKPGFELEFEFKENEYFTNQTLNKTYYYDEKVKGGDFVYDHAEGCEINWKDGKDLTVTTETKKQRHKGTSKTRVVKRTVPANTFFNFFSPPTSPEDVEEMDEEEAEELDQKLENDYELGEEFKENIIPHAVDYFTGKALQYEDEEDFDDEFTDEDEEESEDDDEEDEDDDDAPPVKGENAPECKQS